AGHRIAKGEMIIIALLSANRDATEFGEHADDFNVTRTPNRHIAFWQGSHLCVGAPLARMEGDVAVTALLKRMPNLRLAVPRESITWRVSSNLRGLTALPVEF